MSSLCGCFYCLETFAPSAIDVWIDDGTCALCPNCTIDSVIGDASGFPVADRSFLEAMHKRWFGKSGVPMEDLDKLAELLKGESGG